MRLFRHLFATLGLLCAIAPMTGRGEPSPAIITEEPLSCVWKILGSRNTVYIAGSVHLLREQDFPLPTAYDVAYDDSDRLYFEVDMADMNDAKTLEKMRKLGMFPGKDTLRRHISDGTYKLLAAHLTSRGLPTLLFEKMKPGLLAISLSSMEALRMGARPDLGLEVIYHQKSLKDKKPSGGLETVEFQVTLFDKLSDREQDRMLRATLEKIDSMQDLLKNLIAAWKVGNIQEMDTLLNEEFKEDPNLKSILIDKRNQNWIPKIEEAFLSKENVLFIVGAGHLVGKGNVIELLENRGYSARQLTSPAAKPVAAK